MVQNPVTSSIELGLYIFDSTDRRECVSALGLFVAPEAVHVRFAVARIYSENHVPLVPPEHLEHDGEVDDAVLVEDPLLHRAAVLFDAVNDVVLFQLVGRELREELDWLVR